jgi:hypothetical protein
MSRTIRGRRVSYDNILYATVASKEILVIGTSVCTSGPSEVYGGGSNLTVGTSFPTSAHAQEHIITQTGGSTSDYVNEMIENTN